MCPEITDQEIQAIINNMVEFYSHENVVGEWRIVILINVFLFQRPEIVILALGPVYV